MPKSKAKTKAGKQKAMHKEMKAFSEGKLKSGSGETVTNRKQAVAIGLKQSGLARKAKRGKK